MKAPCVSQPNKYAVPAHRFRQNLFMNTLNNGGTVIKIITIIPINPTELFINDRPAIMFFTDSPKALPTIGTKLPANFTVLAVTPSALADIHVLNARNIENIVITPDSAKAKKLFILFMISDMPLMPPIVHAIDSPKQIFKIGKSACCNM